MLHKVDLNKGYNNGFKVVLNSACKFNSTGPPERRYIYIFLFPYKGLFWLALIFKTNQKEMHIGRFALSRASTMVAFDFTKCF